MGAAQAILAGGVVVAGLLGGVVTLVLDFPTGWAILTATGAFLLTASLTSVYVDRYRATHVSDDDPDDGTWGTRRVLIWIARDLDVCRRAIENSIERGHYWDPTQRRMPNKCFARFELSIAEQPSLRDLYGKLRKAFHEVSRIEVLVEMRAQGDSFEVKDDDNLPRALRVIRAGERAIGGALAEFEDFD